MKETQMNYISLLHFLVISIGSFIIGFIFLAGSSDGALSIGVPVSLVFFVLGSFAFMTAMALLKIHKRLDQIDMQQANINEEEVGTE